MSSDYEYSDDDADYYEDMDEDEDGLDGQGNEGEFLTLACRARPCS